MGKKKAKTETESLRDMATAFKAKARPIINRMAKCRDDLRNLIHEYECLADDNENAMSDIERAVDIISERY